MNLEKSKLEKEKEKLLVTNVDMAEETKNLILEKKQWENLKQVRYFFIYFVFCCLSLSISIPILMSLPVLKSLCNTQEVLQTNEELAEEVDKLYKSEDRILLEREKLSEEMKSLRATSQNLKKLIHDLEEERSKQKVVIQKLFQENLNNRVLMVDKFTFIFKFSL